GTEQNVLNQGKETIGNIFPPRHAAAKRSSAQDPGGQHTRVKSARDHGGHRWNQRRSVLVIGMEHDYDVSSGGEGETVARFLVAAVTAVFRMNFNAHSIEGPGNDGGLVM